MTAIAQWGKPEPEPFGWRDAADDDDGEACDAADSESMEADDAAAAEEREAITESRKVVSVMRLRVRRVGEQEEPRQKRVDDPRRKGG